MTIKLIKSKTQFNYIVDILNIDVDTKAKTVNIVDTTSQSYKIQYSDQDLFNQLAADIENGQMNDVQVALFQNESDLKALNESIEENTRKPGENPRV